MLGLILQCGIDAVQHDGRGIRDDVEIRDTEQTRREHLVRAAGECLLDPGLLFVSGPVRYSTPVLTLIVPPFCTTTPIDVVPEPAVFCKVPVLTSVGVGQEVEGLQELAAVLRIGGEGAGVRDLGPSRHVDVAGGPVEARARGDRERVVGSVRAEVDLTACCPGVHGDRRAGGDRRGAGTVQRTRRSPAHERAGDRQGARDGPSTVAPSRVVVPVAGMITPEPILMVAPLAIVTLASEDPAPRSNEALSNRRWPSPWR